MAPDGTLLRPGEIGEIVIRGPNVTAGYENNPKANAEAFAHGWFHTGDQGMMDAEGYLRITGRLKEIINRGGEKISPREVDEVLMDHPAVAQVVTFAMPHDKLGEEVAAAVVLREGMHGERARAPRFLRRRGSPTSRCRASSCSWTRSRRARPASCSGSGSGRRSSGLGRMKARCASASSAPARSAAIVGAKLAAKGEAEVSLVARGPHLARDARATA